MDAIKAIVIDTRDNVATAIADIEANTEVSIKVGEGIRKIVVKQPVPFGHKFALKEIRRSADVIKYGELIGKAIEGIRPGEHVHIHNVESTRGKTRKEGG